VKVTVCELRDSPDDLERDWERLVAHVKAEGSDLVLLPEMPFYPWFAVKREFDAAVWQAAVDAHDQRQSRLHELAPALVLGSRPVTVNSKRLNEGFAWEQANGYRAAHVKHYLPDEDGFWEASWYSRGDGAFMPIQCGAVRIGFQICTDIWFTEHARAYGKQGVHLIATPRATEKATVDKWLVAGRAAAIVSGAYSLSSTRASSEGSAANFGGQGWIVGPDGQVLGLTSRQGPFVTVEIDLEEAERAKQTYPRYVLE